MLDSAYNLAAGTIIDGRYQIVREIGRGGMSTVYLAEHALIGRRVAVKVLHAEVARSADSVERFLAEARTVGTLGHPNVVASTDMGHLPDGRPYLILELLEGWTLAEEIAKTGRLPYQRAVLIAMQIASAVHAAHSRGIVHRDLKSDNVFLSRTGHVADHVKILDFGISKFLQTPLEIRQTQRGVILGTPEFMAPEQIHSPDEVDHRADIYALGTILHHMLTGQTPFERTPAPQLWNRIMNEPPRPILDAAVPGPLAEIVQQTLAKLPADRPQTMLALHDLLAPFAPVIRASTYPTPVPAASPSSPWLPSLPHVSAVATPFRDVQPAPRSRSQPESTQRVSRPLARRWLWALLVVILPLAGGVATGLLWLLPDQPGSPPVAPTVAATEPLQRPAPSTMPDDTTASNPASAPAADPGAAGAAASPPASDPGEPLPVRADGEGTAEESEEHAQEHAQEDGEAHERRGRDERRAAASSQRAAATSAGDDARGSTTTITAGTPGTAGTAGPRPRSETPARPRIEPPTPARDTGRVDPEATKRVVRAHLDDVRTCHERGRMDVPGLAGRVVMRITIGNGGRVTSATVASSTLGVPSVEKCIAHAVENWTFPAPTGGSTAVIAYPFVLK